MKTFVVDSREKRPYEFDSPTMVKALPVGDYSLLGLESRVSIERKTLGDLINCLCHDRARFERELYKSKSLNYFALIIEGSLSDLGNGKYLSKMRPKSAIQSLLAFSVRYHLPIFFCENREYAQRVTEGLLCKFAREIEKQYETIGND